MLSLVMCRAADDKNKKAGMPRQNGKGACMLISASLATAAEKSIVAHRADDSYQPMPLARTGKALHSSKHYSCLSRDIG